MSFTSRASYWRSLLSGTIFGLSLMAGAASAQAFLPVSKQSVPDVVSVNLRAAQTTPEAVVRVLEEVAAASFGRVHVTPPVDATELQVDVYRNPGRVRVCPIDALIVRAGVFERALHGCVQRMGSAVHIALRVFDRPVGRWQDLVCGLPAEPVSAAVLLRNALIERFAVEGWPLQ